MPEGRTQAGAAALDQALLEQHPDVDAAIAGQEAALRKAYHLKGPILSESQAQRHIAVALYRDEFKLWLWFHTFCIAQLVLPSSCVQAEADPQRTADTEQLKGT